jgi:hypothetical protein
VPPRWSRKPPEIEVGDFVDVQQGSWTVAKNAVVLSVPKAGDVWWKIQVDQKVIYVTACAVFKRIE